MLWIAVMLPYLLFLLLPASADAATAEATIHQEFRYQLPKATLKWTPVAGLPSGLRIIPESAEIWGAPNEAGQYSFDLQASDGTRLTLDLKVNALWNLSLTPPQAAVDVGFSHRQVVAGGTPPYAFSATGLPPGLTISRDGLISGTPLKAGAYEATITASDHAGNTLALPYKLTVNAVGIMTKELPFAEVDKPYAQQLVAAGGKPPYTWKLVEGCTGLRQVPAALQSFEEGVPGSQPPFAFNGAFPEPVVRLSSDGQLTSLAPLQYDQTFCVQVTDSLGNQQQTWVNVISLAPSYRQFDGFLNIPAEVSVGDGVVANVVTSSGTSPYSVSLLSAPPGFVLYPEQRLILGRPQIPGNHIIRIQMRDRTGAAIVWEGSLYASPVRVGSASGDEPTYGKPFSRQYYAVNAAPPYSWQVNSIPGLFGAQVPAGLNLSSAGLLSGTPLESGLFFPGARIVDALGNTRNFGLFPTISAGTPKTLNLTSGDTTFLTVGRQAKFTLDAGYPNDQGPYTWSVTGGVPPGMTQLSDPAGRITFWGVPSIAGSYPLSVRVTDAKGNAGFRIVPLHVTGLHADSLDLPNGVAGVMNQIRLPVNGGIPPYTWSSGNYSLPAGMTLSRDGILSGIPPHTGGFGFSATVTDSASNILSLWFFWFVDAIQIVEPQFPPVLPIGKPVALHLEVRGGEPGYSWKLEDPDCRLAGLTLSPSGLLAGIPTGVGRAGCGVIVTDANGRTAYLYVEFEIGYGGPTRPKIFGPVSGNGTVGEFFSTRLDVLAAKPYFIGPAPGSELPAGLSVSGGNLTGYPTKPGRYRFEIQVTDPRGEQATTRAYINVSALHIVPYAPTAIYKQAYSYQFRLLEHQASVLWTVEPGSRLPVGVTLSADGLLSGIPLETGSFPFQIRANDAEATVQFSVSSGSALPLDVLPPAPVEADVGEPLAISLGGYVGTVFSVIGGSLPPGLSLSAEGELTGMPTTAGVFTFTVRLDAYQGFGIAIITVRVGQVRGEQLTLSPATVGKPYRGKVQGGTLAPGDVLPPGLTLAPDGALSGTPTTPWLYRFSVTLDVGPGDSVISTYTLEVLEED